MDLDSIFSALLAADKAAAEEDPFAPLASVSDSLGQKVLEYSLGEEASVKDSVIGGLITGLLGGASKGLGRNYREKQSGLAQDVLLDAMRGGSVFSKRPEGMSASVFAPVSRAGSVFSAVNEIGEAAEARKATRDARTKFNETVVENMLKDPYAAKRGMQEVEALYGPKQANPAQPIVGPQTQYESLLEKYQGNKALVDAEMKRQLEAPDRQFEQGLKSEGALQDLRKEFQALPEVKAFTISDIGFKSLQKAIQDPASTSDLELVRGAIQAIEPGMAVREGEQAAVLQSGAILDQWKGVLVKALSGESSLPPEVRDGILRIAERRFNEHATTFNAARQFYMSQAQRRGLPDPTGITYQPEATVAPLSPNPPPVPEGMKLQKNIKTGEYRVVPK